MTRQTRLEILRCQKFLQRSDISESDRIAAERGLNDWFCQSLFDEGLLPAETTIEDFQENYEVPDHRTGR